jgi:hypothetical protein
MVQDEILYDKRKVLLRKEPIFLRLILIYRNGGYLMSKYKGVANMTCRLFPDYDWQCWRFDGPLPGNYWESKENVKKFLDYFAGKAKVSSWKYVSEEDIVSQGGFKYFRMGFI